MSCQSAIVGEHDNSRFEVAPDVSRTSGLGRKPNGGLWWNEAGLHPSRISVKAERATGACS